MALDGQQLSLTWYALQDRMTGCELNAAGDAGAHAAVSLLCCIETAFT